MDEVTCARLLALNRAFYSAVAAPFDATRQAPTPGKARLVQRLGALAAASPRPLRVLDVGCGNGRLAFMLDELAQPLDYVGVDGEAQLLTLAESNTQALQHVRSRFVQADMAQPDWTAALNIDRAADGALFDVVTCLATLQHMPSFALRSRLITELAQLVAPTGQLVISAWQFLESERLVARRLDWSVADVDPQQVEPGDALLPWKQDVYAVRYVHQVDAAEFARLATAAQLTIADSYRADGRSGDLNLYVYFQRENEIERGSGG